MPVRPHEPTAAPRRTDRASRHRLQRWSAAAFLAGSLAGLAIVTGACGRPDPPQSVFLITLDTLRADHLGAWGYRRDVSPFLDELARRSTVFTRVYASSSHTAPCHASLFTGLEPAQHRLLQNGEELDPRILTVAEIFRRRGYRTAAFSTTGFLEGLRSGFEHFSARKKFFPAREIVDEALGWLAERAPEEKVFVWIHLFDAHEWYHPDLVDPQAREELGRRRGPHGEELVDYLTEQQKVPLDVWRSRAEMIDGFDRYDAQIVAMDRQLRRLYDTLEETGLNQDAVWWVTADHGEGMGNHHFFGHGQYLYNEQIHVPLLVFAPGRDFPPARVDRLVRQVDAGPSLAALIGEDFKAQLLPIEGRSLLPLLEDPTAPWMEMPAFSLRRPVDQHRRELGWEPGEVFSLTTPRYKIIVHTQGEHELFDLRADPFELVNRIDERSDAKDGLLRQAVRRFRHLFDDGEKVGTGEINPQHVEELKTLGYL